MAKRRSAKLGNNRESGRHKKTPKRLAAKKRMLEIKALKPAERKKALAEEREKQRKENEKENKKENEKK